MTSLTDVGELIHRIHYTKSILSQSKTSIPTASPSPVIKHTVIMNQQPNSPPHITGSPYQIRCGLREGRYSSGTPSSSHMQRFLSLCISFSPGLMRSKGPMNYTYPGRQECYPKLQSYSIVQLATVLAFTVASCSARKVRILLNHLDPMEKLYRADLIQVYSAR